MCVGIYRSNFVSFYVLFTTHVYAWRLWHRNRALEIRGSFDRCTAQVRLHASEVLKNKSHQLGGGTVNLSQPVNHTGLKSGKRLARAKKGQKVDSGLEIWGWSVYMDPKSQPFWDSIGQRLTRVRKNGLISLHGPKKSTFLGLNRSKG